uniref:Protein kinase domain-containing protein n=1 Tax=Cyprinus carpio TaxID=7962 RepID=A0A8C2PZT6_CYPCA
MIAEELGRGQFGIVHRCIETSSEKTYMAKFVKRLGTANFELNEREIVNYIRQVCEALEFLHSKSY